MPFKFELVMKSLLNLELHISIFKQLVYLLVSPVYRLRCANQKQSNKPAIHVIYVLFCYQSNSRPSTHK